MASDYEAIRCDNIKRYGTDIGRIGRMLLANRYDERTHFIFELLQNAEDALGRSPRPAHSSIVSFHLRQDDLRVSHYGAPFTEGDVRAICGIDESTKKINEIGRFGIGFKSVYAFTDRPQIHSGHEDFAVEEYVRPIAIPGIERSQGETVISIPFKCASVLPHHEIADALRRLGAHALLFLRHIDEIDWRVDSGVSGQYLRESEEIDTNVRQIVIIGEEHGKATPDEDWLIFSRPVISDDIEIQPIEIAFSCVKDAESGDLRIQRAERSPLTVLFPTAVETHLGFLLQGPYRTTPSRDNIKRNDSWNQGIVKQTAVLLRTSLCWLRDHRMLSTDVLRCLPLDPGKFSGDTILAPLFSCTKDILSTENLLPGDNGEYISAPNARLARTGDLRDLFDKSTLAALYGKKHRFSWLAGRFTRNRTPDLCEYLVRILNVPEDTPESVIRRLDSEFLITRTDNWIRKLYEFLSGQPALSRHLSDIPIIRLEDGTHVPPMEDGSVSAYLPGDTETGFRTVRAAVATSEAACKFLRSLGLKDPDVVDDVIVNILPKYQNGTVTAIGDAEYTDDISRIFSAYKTDSLSQKEKLVKKLTTSRYVKSVRPSDKFKSLVRPTEVYLPTDRLRRLLDGANNILFVDDSYACLRGEAARSVLAASGAFRYLEPVPADTVFTGEERRSMRIEEKCESCTREFPITDYSLRGLEEILALLPQLDDTARTARANLLWDALEELHKQRGESVFWGVYRWQYHTIREKTFGAAFVQRLQESRWVPGTDGKLHRPQFVSFDSLEWKKDPFLESVIHFKPADVDILAGKLGIQPEMIEVLREAGIETEEALRKRLGLITSPTSAPEAPISDRSGHVGANSEIGETVGSGRRDDTGAEGALGPRRSRSGAFISYITVSFKKSEEGETRPDGFTHENRMDLEKRAINFILESEPDWQRTPSNNPGYDLFRIGKQGRKEFCEVKAMTGTLDDRPVGMSRTQFDHAYKHGESFWLYVVEHAESSTDMRLLRIQDPAGKARTFTYDSGWRAVGVPRSFPYGEEGAD